MKKILLIGALYNNKDDRRYYDICLSNLRIHQRVFREIGLHSDFLLHIDNSVEIDELKYYSHIIRHNFSHCKKDFNQLEIGLDSPSTSTRAKNKPKLVKVCRFDTFFSQKYFDQYDFLVSIDVHDDIRINATLIDQKIKYMLRDDKKFYFSYWQSSERNCFHHIKHFTNQHIHSDAGLFIAREPLPINEDILYLNFAYYYCMNQQQVFRKGIEEITFDIYLNSFSFFQERKNDCLIEKHETNCLMDNNNDESSSLFIPKRRKLIRIANPVIDIEHTPHTSMKQLPQQQLYVCSDVS